MQADQAPAAFWKGGFFTATVSNAARISGMASGLDVEAIVEGLTKKTQMKIEEEEKQLQLLEWKREAYQEVADALYTFMNAYCGSSSGPMPAATGLLTPTAVCPPSEYVTVTATGQSVPGEVYIADILSLASAARVRSAVKVSAPAVMTADAGALAALPGRSMNVTLDGVTKTLTFPDGPYDTAEDAANALQSLMDAAFGAGRAAVSLDGNVLSLDAGNSVLRLNDSGLPGGEASEILGFANGAGNRLTLTKPLSESNLAAETGGVIEFSVNGIHFSFTSSDALSDIMRRVSDSDANVTMTYSEAADAFTIAAKDTGAASSVVLSDLQGSFLAAILGTGVRTAGTDAVLKVGFGGETGEDGLVTLLRSTNTFSIDGTVYALKGKAPGEMAEGISVRVETDAETAAEKIAGFIDAYNDLLGAITGKLYEKAYKDYQPLTGSEKKDLTDREIEEWTENAKSGLLRGDAALQSLYYALRGAMAAAVKDFEGNDLNITLASIGITSPGTAGKGQLAADKEKLLAALKEKPETVLRFLTQSSRVSYSYYLTPERASARNAESGLLYRVGDIVKNSLSAVGNKGVLVSLVGSPSREYAGTTDYSKKISAKKKEINALLSRLSDEEDKYWKKFTALETSLSQLQSMSGYVNSMLAV